MQAGVECADSQHIRGQCETLERGEYWLAFFIECGVERALHCGVGWGELPCDVGHHSPQLLRDYCGVNQCHLTFGVADAGNRTTCGQQGRKPAIVRRTWRATQRAQRAQSAREFGHATRTIEHAGGECAQCFVLGEFEHSERIYRVGFEELAHALALA